MCTGINYHQHQQAIAHATLVTLSYECITNRLDEKAQLIENGGKDIRCEEASRFFSACLSPYRHSRQTSLYKGLWVLW